MKYLNCSCRHNVLCKPQPHCILPEALLPSRHQCWFTGAQPQLSDYSGLLSSPDTKPLSCNPPIPSALQRLPQSLARFWKMVQQRWTGKAVPVWKFENKKTKPKLKQNNPRKTKMKHLLTISLHQSIQARKAMEGSEMGYTLVHTSFFKMCMYA